MKRLLWIVIILSLIPASLLVVRRVQAEGSRSTVTLIMDEVALADQARYLGLSSLELALRYQALGLNGIALYEETLESLQAKGAIIVMLGPDAINLALGRGEALPDISADSLLIYEVVPGAARYALAKNPPDVREITLAERNWYVYPGSAVNQRPAGPNRNLIEAYAEAGFDIAYRPRNFPAMKAVAEDFPAEARYLVHAGLQVAGFPSRLQELEQASKQYLTGIIEGTEQDGMRQLNRKIPTVRLLSFNQDYVNRRLHPEELIDKYLLAANERGIRIMYLRPYTEEQLGDMFENTEKLVAGLRERLEREGYLVGPLPDLELNYETSALLRGLSSLGIVAGLGLLLLMYPGAWGILVLVAVAGLGFVAGGLSWAALALMAALTFPVLGFGHLSERLSSLGVATLVSLAGAVLLSAVGSDRDSMLAITPFAGVGATLVVPPALFLFHYALKFRSPAQWITEFWHNPIRLSHVILGLVALAAVAVILMRRGNFPIIPATEAELAFRSWLANLFTVRPRFKELAGHVMAVVGLSNASWPGWIKAGFLTGGVVAQATILNSFSHYHTPLIISLQRTLLALVIGLLLGLLLSGGLRLMVMMTRRWLTASQAESKRRYEAAD